MALNPLTSVRLAQKEIEEIDQLVKDGVAMSRADFVRDAIRDKLKSMRIKMKKSGV